MENEQPRRRLECKANMPYIHPMTTLTVTSKGQITLRKDILKHLGVEPGGTLAVEKLPNGRIEVRVERPSGEISDVFQFLENAGRPERFHRRDERDRRKGLGWQAVKVTADTNVLVRAIMGDDEAQSAAAQNELANAESVAVTIPVLCELVSVLSQAYKIERPEIAKTIRFLLNVANVALDRPAAEAGRGADVFVSFDKKAARLVEIIGIRSRLLER
jgi:AbrB family looped-hinge helix DNA binding protein